MITVSALFIYPIKSCRGSALQQVHLDDLGPELDRRFVVVDASNRFITQRDEPRLAWVVPTITETTLQIAAPGMPALRLPTSLADDGPSLQIEVWEHRGDALDAGDDAAAWFSEFLGRSCRLAWCPPARVRRVDEKYAPEAAYTGFSDGFPELLLSEESIRDLNLRSGNALPVDRFRPNIVVRGVEPYSEDGWKRIRIGDVPFDVVKPCARCVITTIDQVTAEVGKEPLATLARYRRQGRKVMFGQNCIHRELGTIRVGDRIELLG